ncbi:cytochrome bc complex cytochrome b subunit [Microlunatus sp. GCM10028923]|uniref:cytochrome bc1 complex cytochrome b subunit n=1 Tax=Microlunatus sp. GCM10028923 TaxID=3273400 RepID=UPI0036172471
MAKPASTVTESSATEAQTPAKQPGPLLKAAAGPAGWADERLSVAKLGRANLRKIFPDHWSFLLGEIALYSFIVLLITGVFLTLWFKPSMAEIEYDGSYQLLKGLHMSEAFASTLNISFDIRGGLLVRQMHHWAALLFVVAMYAHMMRTFFTGAFRKPRELNWILGVLLLMTTIIAGLTGYSLPDDLLSGTGVRFVDGLIRSVPLIGTWAEFFVFGGEFPGDLIISRFYMAHILLVPAILLGLIAVHVGLVFYQKHTQYPGPGRTEKNVVGFPLFPVYMAKAGGFFFIVFGVIALMGAVMQINPVWAFGPYNPAEVTAGSQPDWYLGFVEGAVRIMPGLESHIGGTTWSWNIFVPGVGLMMLFPGILVAYPFIERWVTGDNSEHHILERPRNNPTRTAFGIAGITCYGLFWAGGGNDLIAVIFDVSLNSVTDFLRVAVFVGPVIAFMITKRVCIGLQRRDEARLLHGAESGIIVRDPSGGYEEKHVPISQDEAFTLTQHKEYLPLEPIRDGEGDGLRDGEVKAENRRRLATRFFYRDALRKPTRAELEAAAEHQAHGNGHENGHGNGNGHGELEAADDQAELESGDAATRSGTTTH